MNITSFLNLMVVLIPFLLLTAVFNQVSAIDLQVAGGQAGALGKEGLSLEVLVDQESIRVHGAGDWRERFDIGRGENWSVALGRMVEVLREMKSLHPGEKNAMVSFSPLIDYQRVVDVLSATRGSMIKQDGMQYRIELFPSISVSLIGDDGGAALSAGGN